MILALLINVNQVYAQKQFSDSEIYSIGTVPQKYLGLGFTTGKAQYFSEKYRFVGFETSYSLTNSGRWFGVYSDVNYEITNQITTISMGPKLGAYVKAPGSTTHVIEMRRIRDTIHELPHKAFPRVLG